MSHFYRQRSYTFAESDELFTDIRKEMSNFLTKEEAESIFNRRYAIIDPNPFYEHHKVEKLLDEVFNLKQEIYLLNQELNKIKHQKEYDEPTM